jgi:hypothetical protein
MRRRAIVTGLAAEAALSIGTPSFSRTDPLPSWNDEAVEKSILEFVDNGPGKPVGINHPIAGSTRHGTRRCAAGGRSST